MIKLYKKYILPYMKQYKWSMIATIFLGVLTILVSSMLTFTSGYLITRASERPETILLLYIPIVGVRTFGISKAVSHYLERLFGHNTVLKILSEMRVKLYNVLEPQALFIRSRFQTGDLLGTLSDDIEHLQDAYIRTIFPTITALFIFVYSVAVLALFDWKFALWIALCMSIVVFVYPMLSLYILKKQQMVLKEKRQHLYQSWTDALFGITDWIISGRTTSYIQNFMKKSKEAGLIEKRLENWNQSRAFQLQVLSAIILIFVGLWAGNAALAGDILPTYIAAFTLVVFPLMEGMIPTSEAIEKLPSYQESLMRLEKIEDYKPHKLAVNKPELHAKPDISIQNVSFHYEGEQTEALKNFSLEIPYGSKVAILGKSGAGKSTLLQLLLGELVPTNGKIEIGGSSPEQFGDHIFETVSVLNQKPYLFATTVGNNVRLGKSDATEEEIKKVIQQVKLDDYVLSLAKGLNTQMEETGQRFSGGERQRVALARILLKNTPIVILDEPTVGLDPVTEIDLLDTVFTNLQDKTMIMITHHLIGMEKMDQIIFLDQGEIAMIGTHEELMDNSQRYRDLYLMDYGEM